MARIRVVLLSVTMILLACGASAGQVRIVVLSDFNGSYGSTSYNDRVGRAVSAAIALGPDIVLSTGDMVAGQRSPTLSDDEVRAMWSAFHRTVTDPLARAGIPFAVTPGNHDASAYSRFEGERRIYAEEWRQRRPALDFVEASDYPFFYAFDIGGVRIASLDATTVGALPAGQMSRLRDVFDGAGKSRIVFSHLPLWPFTIGRETEIIGDPVLQSLLEDLEIDLHLSGHHHGFYPGSVGSLAVVSQACLGSGPRKLIGADKASPPAITVIDISPDGGIRVEGRTGPDFSTPVALEHLPERLVGGTAIIDRLDLSPTGDVTVR